ASAGLDVSQPPVRVTGASGKKFPREIKNSDGAFHVKLSNLRAIGYMEAMSSASTLPELLRERARTHRESVLLVERDRRMTYGGLADAAARAAGAFARLRVEKGDKGALLLGNCPEVLTAGFAAAAARRGLPPGHTPLAAP